MHMHHFPLRFCFWQYAAKQFAKSISISCCRRKAKYSFAAELKLPSNFSEVIALIANEIFEFQVAFMIFHKW